MLSSLTRGVLGIMLEGMLFLSCTSNFSKPVMKKKKKEYKMLAENKSIIGVALWSVYHRFPVDRDGLRQTLPSWHLQAELQPMKKIVISI